MSSPGTDTSPRRRFELRRRIGAGAFGEVFLAEQVSAGDFRRPVAIKVLHAGTARSKEAARRMRDEARILGRLSHRNIVEVLDLVQFGDRWAVVMAYVPGADLEQILALLASRGDGGLPAPAVCEIGAAVARALHAAWTATDDTGRPLRVVHRDIKPSNIRVGVDGDVKVLDFGVARVDLDGREARTRAPGLIGTERYMAPERLMLEGDGPEGDVYALGATLVELLYGEPLGPASARVDVHTARIAERVELATAAVAPADARQVLVEQLTGMLAYEPSARPVAADVGRTLELLATRLAGEHVADLAAWAVPAAPSLDDGTPRSVNGTLVEGSGAPQVAGLPGVVSPADEAGVVGDGGTRRPIGWLLGVAGLLAAAAVGVLVLALSTGDAPAPAPAAAAAVVVAPPPAVERAPEPVAVTPVVPDPSPVDAEPVEVARPRPAPAAAAAAAAALARRAAAHPPETAPPTVEQVAAPAASDATTLVARALFVVPDVSSIDVSCGARTFHGTASVRAVDFPAGRCVVRVVRGEEAFRGSVEVTSPREVLCTVGTGELSCR